MRKERAKKIAEDSLGLHYVKSTGDRVFDTVNALILTILAIATLYPFWYIVVISISTPAEASAYSLHLYAHQPIWNGYKSVLMNQYIWLAYRNTILRTVIGTAFTMFMTTILAYALSKKYLPNRNFYTSIIVFTMFFGGGLIPTYLLIKNLGLLNNFWVLIIPGAIGTYSMIIMRNYFQAQPAELEESAKIDGANDLRILWNIYVPISKPVFATIVLWTMVGNWNAWFDAMIYLTNRQDLIVLQLLLRRLIQEGSTELINNGNLGIQDSTVVPSLESLKAASIMVATLPILLVYPFIQKYFVKGIMIGSLKG